MLRRVNVQLLFAEFIGSASLAMAVLAMSGRTNFPFYGAVVAGLVYAVFILAMRPSYTLHINPIVSAGLWTIRQISTVRAVSVIAAQLLGGVFAWQMSELLLDSPLRNIAGGKIDWRVLAAEALGAAIFVYVLIAVMNRKVTDAVYAFTAGASLAFGMLVASLASNGLINPALAIGLQSWSWSYVLGPLAGALIGINIYMLLQLLDMKMQTNESRSARTKKAKTTKKAAKKPAKKTSRKK